MFDAAPTRIRRQADFSLSTGDLWELIAEPERLASWLGDSVSVEMRPGGLGIVTDNGVTRHVRVDTVEPGTSLSFTWWQPGVAGTASTVTLEIDERPDGSSRLNITETLLSSVSRASLNEARARWEVRVLSLWACTVAAALVR